MLRPKSTISAVTPKILLGFSVLCLVSAAILGLLTGYEEQKKAAKAGAKVAQLQTEKTDLQTKVAQLENEKTDLQTKVEADQNEIASLQKRIEESQAATKPSESPGAASAPEQQLTAPPPSLEIRSGAASTPEQPTSLPLRQKLNRNMSKKRRLRRGNRSGRQLQLRQSRRHRSRVRPGRHDADLFGQSVATYAPKPDTRLKCVHATSPVAEFASWTLIRGAAM